VDGNPLSEIFIVADPREPVFVPKLAVRVGSEDVPQDRGLDLHRLSGGAKEAAVSLLGVFPRQNSQERIKQRVVHVR
jgi:hypothetical protein